MIYKLLSYILYNTKNNLKYVSFLFIDINLLFNIFLLYKLFSNILYNTKNNIKSVRLCLLK